MADEVLEFWNVLAPGNAQSIMKKLSPKEKQKMFIMVISKKGTEGIDKLLEIFRKKGVIQ